MSSYQARFGSTTFPTRTTSPRRTISPRRTNSPQQSAERRATSPPSLGRRTDSGDTTDNEPTTTTVAIGEPVPTLTPEDAFGAFDVIKNTMEDINFGLMSIKKATEEATKIVVDIFMSEGFVKGDVFPTMRGGPPNKKIAYYVYDYDGLIYGSIRLHNSGRQLKIWLFVKFEGSAAYINDIPDPNTVFIFYNLDAVRSQKTYFTLCRRIINDEQVVNLRKIAEIVRKMNTTLGEQFETGKMSLATDRFMLPFDDSLRENLIRYETETARAINTFSNYSTVSR